MAASRCASPERFARGKISDALYGPGGEDLPRAQEGGEQESAVARVEQPVGRYHREVRPVVADNRHVPARERRREARGGNGGKVRDKVEMKLMSRPLQLNFLFGDGASSRLYSRVDMLKIFAGNEKHIDADTKYSSWVTAFLLISACCSNNADTSRSIQGLCSQHDMHSKI